MQGFLKEQQVGYKTKPRSIILDTTISVPIPKKAKLFFGGEIGLPLDTYINDIEPVVKANIILKTKKDNLFHLGIDTQFRLWVGMSFKF